VTESFAAIQSGWMASAILSLRRRWRGRPHLYSVARWSDGGSDHDQKSQKNSQLAANKLDDAFSASRRWLG